MGTEIASLYAKLGLDATELKKGLAASADALTRLGGDFTKVSGSLDSLISQYKASTPENLKYARSIASIQEAFDRGDISSQQAAKQLQAIKNQMGSASKSLETFKSGFQSLTGISLTAAGGFAAVGMAINQIKKAVNETVAYNSSIKDTARLIGLDLEQTSRLVQASDDLFLSQESLKTGLQAATRQGIDVSIEGLKKLSEQYLALDPKQERGTFLMKTFGRSGAEMYKIMEQGAGGIDKAMAAVEKSLIVTDKSIASTEEYKRNLDKLSDSWMGLKIAVGNGVIPVLNAFLSTETDVNKVELQNIKTQEEAIKQAIGRNIAVEENKLKLEALKEAEQRVIAAIENDTTATDANSKAREDAVARLAELKISADALTGSFKPLTNEMIYNSLAASLDSQGQLDLARHLGLVNEGAFNAINQIQALKDKYDINKDGVIDLTERTAAYYAELKKVTDTAGTYQWNFVVKTNDTVAPAPPTSVGSVPHGKIEPHASGGSFMIPWAYGNEGFRLGNGDTASGGEKLTITPKGKDGGGNQIILTDEMLKKIGEASGNATAMKLMQLGML